MEKKVQLLRSIHISTFEVFVWKKYIGNKENSSEMRQGKEEWQLTNNRKWFPCFMFNWHTFAYNATILLSYSTTMNKEGEGHPHL